jgi:DNA (cytosine-5)-methyltransferase 1
MTGHRATTPRPGTPRIGSLFSGTGGLDRGVQAVLGGTVAWHSEIDPGACKILAHRYPDVPNLGDVERVGLPFSDEEWKEIKAAQKFHGVEYEMPAPDWSGVDLVDVLTGGFPCTDVSAAGKREGIRPGTRSGLWGRFLDAIEQLRPPLVVIENVRGLLSADAHHPAHSELESCPWEMGDGSGPTLRALGAVLGDLADIGFDAEWVGLRAADVGAPHGRFRVFVVAWPADAAGDGLEGPGSAFPSTGREGAPALGRRPADRGGSIAAADAVSGRRDGRTPDAVGFPFGGTAAPRGGEVAGGGAAAADADGLGHERGRRARDRRPGPADGGVTAADASSDRRHERRTEPARLVRGSDAALGRDAAADPDGDGLEGVGRVHPSGRDADRRRGEDRVGQDDQPATRGELDVDPAQAGPGEVLRELRGAGDAQAVQRPTGGSRGVSATPVLREELREQQGRGDERRPPLAGPASSDPGVRGLCDDQRSARSSRGPEPREQRPGESADALFVVSSAAALAGGPRGAAGRCEASGGYGCSSWGQYAPAIHRWEMVLGRLAPPPTELSVKGAHRLSARAVEFMMGLPAGWVTDVPGLGRNDMLKALGNGVVPAQCAAALRLLLPAAGVTSGTGQALAEDGAA